MKINKLLTLLSILCFSAVIFSQPLNNSFENWEITGMPTDWFTTGPPSVNQVSVAYEGSSAAHLEVIDAGGGFSLIPIIQSLDATFNGHPVSEKHGSLQGWYQFMPLGSDFLTIAVVMAQGNNGVGAGSIAIQNSTSGWTQFTCPIFYAPGSPTPDNTIILIAITDTSTGGEFGTPGSMGYVDYLTFTGPSAVEQISGLPQDYNLTQNYPNPFNPTTNIQYSIPEQSFVDLRVYDILGNEIAVLVNAEQSAGTYRADFTGADLASGFYIARIRAGNYTSTIKMNLLK